MASILHILGLTRDGFLERIIYCLVTISSARVRDITLILHFRVEVFGDIDVVMSGEDVDVYEQLPEGVSLFTTAFAGAAAGIMEHVCMYPVDVVKTRQQALACDKTSLQSRSIIKNMFHIARTEGWRKLVQVRRRRRRRRRE